jgi:hypothetical protein
MSERASRRRAEREASKNRLPADARVGACEGCGKRKPCDVTYRICGRCQVRFLEMVSNLGLLRRNLQRLEDQYFFEGGLLPFSAEEIEALSRFDDTVPVLTDKEHASLLGESPEVAS